MFNKTFCLEVYWSLFLLRVATRIQTRTICQVMTMMVAYYSNMMAMTLDSMAYLKNNDGNAHRYYLRSAVARYLYYKHVYPSRGQG